MRFGFVDHGVVKMQSQLGVDIEGEIQHSGAFIDGHDGAVLAENIDLLIIGVTRLNLIDVCDGKSRIGVDNASVQEALEFQLCAHKQPIQVIHFIREQETAGTVACCVAVLDQVEALQGKGFVKILEKDIVGKKAGVFIEEFITHDECKIVKRDTVFGKKRRPVLFEISGVAADLTEDADAGTFVADVLRRMRYCLLIS